MREFLTTEDICNDLCMRHTVHGGAFLIVEGVTDSRIYGKFIDKEGTQIVVAHSKDNVRNVIRDMAKDRCDVKVLGIMDADLDRLTGRKVSSPLFLTDCRDMEMMAVRSNALNDVLDEYGDREAIENFEKRMGPIRDAVVKASFPIGLLMKVSKERGFALSFKDLDFNSFINQRSLSIDARRMVDEVLVNSRNIPYGTKQILQILNDEARGLDDIWDAARGHDTIKILLIGFRTFGSYNARHLNEGALGGALRLAYSDSDFRQTRLFTDTEKWAEYNNVRLWALVPSEDEGPEKVSIANTYSE